MPDSIVEHYWAASSNQHDALRGASMDMDIDAALPKLKKQGKLHALRRISALGRITYEALRFDGDGTVKNQVIARYLTAEAQAQTGEVPARGDTGKLQIQIQRRGTGRRTHGPRFSGDAAQETGGLV